LLDSTLPAEITLPYPSSERLLLVHVEDVASMLVTLLQVSAPAHAVYNAPCEPIILADLKREIENLNSKITVGLGTEPAVGNPRLLDASRFRQEFGYEATPIFEQLRRQRGKVFAGEGARATLELEMLSQFGKAADDE